MGAGKKAQRQAKQQQLRSRTTRSSRGRVISPSDPETNGRLLNEQLRGLGLYAADTLGDGNCLFRALSDQLYGSMSRHAPLRASVCDWIQAHRDRYAPFVEDERGLDAHLRCMRENGTYGGHLELSAFAHMTGKNVKVMQPGLVYVISANALDDAAPEASTSTAEHQSGDGPLSGREKRQTRRERKRTEKDALPSPSVGTDDDDGPDTVYVAYHDWEHFSSIRNLRGPHAGLPMVQEIHAAPAAQPSAPSTPRKKVPRVKLKLSNPPTPASSSKPPSTVVSPPPSIAPSSIASLAASSLDLASPAQIPLPVSRSPSPLHSRSPKRSFDESSLSSLEETETGADVKRRRPSPLAPAPDDAEDTPELSAPGSASSRESTAFSSSLSELSSDEEDEEEEIVEEPPAPPSPPPAPLTQRQRKKLGLPKQRPGQRSAGTIVIPGGRFKRQAPSTPQPVAVAAPDEEWVRNGTGRVDVRGFRELKI
ncbi:hypothetical protein HDZ31DRAFT_49256 [Schizophyllum fasciatum]